MDPLKLSLDLLRHPDNQLQPQQRVDMRTSARLKRKPVANKLSGMHNGGTHAQRMLWGPVSHKPRVPICSHCLMYISTHSRTFGRECVVPAPPLPGGGGEGGEGGATCGATFGVICRESPRRSSCARGQGFSQPYRQLRHHLILVI